MKTAAAAVVLAAVLGGCASAVKTPTSDLYPYNAMNDNCACEEYSVTDPKVPVSYIFSAGYHVEETFTTHITIQVRNETADTLDMSMGSIKVSSRNVPYRYNNKFVPVTISVVPPHDERTLTLVGAPARMEQRDPWLYVAGEEMVLTLKGLRLKGRQLATQTIRFIPHNPKLSN